MWAAILAADRWARQDERPVGGERHRPHGTLVAWCPQAGWSAAPECPAPLRPSLDLYLPLLPTDPRQTLVVAHLGQSLDGFIATGRGDSCFVNGPENIRHLHRLRALCDAVLVGAETVAADNPRLTTRLVPGDNPVRVVLDPRRRLGADRRVFQEPDAPTLLVCADALAGAPPCGRAETLAVPLANGRLRLDILVERLRARGLRRLFVEGGGLTVSAFLDAGLLDRLHIALSPLLIGQGRRGLCLPPSDALSDCLRPACRIFRLGGDILFDCQPRLSREAPEPAHEGIAIARIL